MNEWVILSKPDGLVGCMDARKCYNRQKYLQKIQLSSRQILFHSLRFTHIYLGFFCLYFQKRVDFLQLMLDAAHNEGRDEDTEHDQEFRDVHGWTEKKGANKKHFFLFATDNLQQAL